MYQSLAHLFHLGDNSCPQNAICLKRRLLHTSNSLFFLFVGFCFVLVLKKKNLKTLWKNKSHVRNDRPYPHPPQWVILGHISFSHQEKTG